jgi:hypothetical protein
VVIWSESHSRTDVSIPSFPWKIPSLTNKSSQVMWQVSFSKSRRKMLTAIESNQISKAAKRRQRKKKSNKHVIYDEKQYHSEMHKEAVKHYFIANPAVVKIFGTDSVKFANFFADQCISEIKKEW